MSTEKLSVSWDDFPKNISTGMHSLLEAEDLVDVTLAAEGRYVKAHKMVLSVCSPYFRELFKTNPCQHPIVFLKDVSYSSLNDLLQFMYKGEVRVLQDDYDTLVKTAEALRIKGFTNEFNIADDVRDMNKSPEEKTQKRPIDSSKFKEVAFVDVETTNGPLSKKPRSEMNKPEVNCTLSTEEVQFKIEPNELMDNDDVLRQVQEDSDDSNDDGMDDYEVYLLNESDAGEAEAGTSLEMTKDNQDFQQALNNLSVFGEVLEETDAARLVPLPEKSIGRYLNEYKSFCSWREENHIVGANEMTMLAFFEAKHKHLKSSCLWAYYAMIRRCLLFHENVDIKRYDKLRNYLREKSVGYTPKKTKVLSHSDIMKFLKEADDDNHLLLKVILILGVFGACRRKELVNLTIDNVEDRGNFIKVSIPKRKGANRNFVIIEEENGCHPCSIVKKYMALRPAGLENRRFLIGYRNKKCIAQVVGINAIGSVPKKVAEYLGLPDANEYTGHCFRSSSFLKPRYPHIC